MNRNRSEEIVKIVKIAKWAGLALGIVIIILSTITFIQSNERGLRFTMGAIEEKSLEPGIHFTIPFIQTIEKIDLRPNQINIQIPITSDGAITKDNQTIGSTVQVFYAYKEASIVTMWKDYGPEKIKSLVTSSVEESFKAKIGGHTIFEVPVKQDEIRNGTFSNVKTKLANYPIETTELRIINYDWSDAFDAQIAQTMEKAQQVKQKEQELAMKEFEAQKIVKQAEADKTATIRKAEGHKEAVRLAAEAKILEGEGIRKFNESIRATQDIEIKLRELAIESSRVDRWNGAYVPNNNYGPIPVQTGTIQGSK